MFKINANCICCEKGKDKIVFVTKNFWSGSQAPCLLLKMSGVKVTPFVTSVESSEQFCCKIRQIWRIFEPCPKMC